MAALGMFLLLAGPLAPSASAATPAPTLDATFSTLLNTLRGTLGLGTLIVDDQLSNVARSWSTQMATSGVMSHNPNVTSQVQGWSKLGENVGTGPAVTQIFNALVASPPHMHNMADPEYTRIGVGTVLDGQGRLWTTHVFERPRSGAVATSAAAPARPAAAPAPAPARAPRPAAAAPAPAPRPAPAPTPAPAPVATTVAPAPVVPASSVQTAEPAPLAVTATPATLNAAHPAPGSERRVPAALLAGAVLVLLALGGACFFVQRARSPRPQPASAPRRSASRSAVPPTPAEDLTGVLDLL